MAYTEGCMCHKGLTKYEPYFIFSIYKNGKGVWKNKNKNLHNFFKVVISCFYLFFWRSHSVVVSTADFESAIVGSNPAGTFRTERFTLFHAAMQLFKSCAN
jgi:hypothetical protein